MQKYFAVMNYKNILDNSGKYTYKNILDNSGKYAYFVVDIWK